MKSFLNACGFREPLRLVIGGSQGSGEELRSLPQPFAVVGRDPRVDVVLDDPSVSRRHVYLQGVAGRVFWIDLESRTGTVGEGGERERGWLALGDGRLRVGPFAIGRPAIDAGAGSVVADPGPGRPGRDSPLAVRSLGGQPLPEVALEFLNGPSRETTWPMNRVMSLVGSARGCKFRLTDLSVSGFHAGLVRTPAGLWVVNLRGDRSIRINDEPARFGPLADGDVLGIGRYRMRVRCRPALADDAPQRGREPAAGLPRAVRRRRPRSRCRWRQPPARRGSRRRPPPRSSPPPLASGSPRPRSARPGGSTPRSPSRCWCRWSTNSA